MGEALGMADWNAQIIEEFRANAGHVGGMFEAMPLLLLHHIGAKTGTERINPLAYRRDGDAYAIFASKAGAPTNPDWFHNLVANPDTIVEVGEATVAVRARVAAPDERDRIYEAQAADIPQFGEYEKATTRKIPVVVLDPA